MKKIYFACSIRGGRDDQPIYAELVELIKESAEVLSELFSDKSLTASGHSNLSDKEIWTRDISWLKAADGVIAEVTNPSLGVGYEIGKASEWGIRVLALYRSLPGKRLSAMIAGSANVEVFEYQDAAETKTKIAEFIDSL